MNKRKSGEITNWLPQLIIALIAAMAAVVVTYYLTINPKPPQFFIETPIVKPGEQIIIKAANKKANRHEPLNVEFDRHVFESAGEPFKCDKDNRQRWRFNIITVAHTPEMIKPGKHEMRFGFKEEDLCKEKQAVSFQLHSSTTVKTGTKSGKSLSAFDVKGFYKAPIEGEFEDLFTLTIEKVDKSSRISTFTFKYILASVEGTDSGTGTLKFSQRTIYIPGLGKGKVSLNKENKFILIYIYKGREVQFVQSNI